MDIKAAVDRLSHPQQYGAAVLSLVDVIDNESQRQQIRQYLRSTNAITKLYNYLRAADNFVREKTSYIFCMLGYEEDGRNLVADTGGIPVLMQFVKDTTQSVYAREKCTWALSNMSLTPKVRAQMVAARGVDFCVQLVKNNPPNLLYVPACNCIANQIKLDDGACAEAVSSGIIQHLVSLTSSYDDELVAVAIEGIGKLCGFMASPRTIAAQCGTFEACLKFLRDRDNYNPSRKTLSSSDTINQLVVNNPSNRQAALQNGSYREHVGMLQAENSQLIEKAIEFFINWTENFKNGQDEMLKDPTIIPLLMRRLKEGGHKASLGVLCHLSLNENAKSYIPIESVEGYFQQLLASPTLNDVERARVAIVLANLSDENKAKSFALDPKVIQFLALKTSEILTGKEDRWSLVTFLTGVANLASNDSNKEVLGDSGIIKTLLDVLLVDPSNCPHGRVYVLLNDSKLIAATALWNLAYYEPNAQKIKQNGGIEILEKALAATTNEKMKLNVNGVLWLLKNREMVPKPPAPVQSTTSNSSTSAQNANIPHIMISYNWGCQEIVKKIAANLQANGYKIWLDIEQMAGSTLDAMAGAVEGSEVVLVCMTRKYKESPACRMEAEYTTTTRKQFLPLLMESNYRPDGWLGIMLGAKLYYDFSSPSSFDASFTGLVKALGNKGKVGAESSPAAVVPKTDAAAPAPEKPVVVENPINKWGNKEVTEWLEKHNLSTYKEKFQTLDVDGPALKQLAQYAEKEEFSKMLEILRREFGVPAIGTNLRLINSLRTSL